MSRVLIIEDDASFRDATALALREAGHETLIATSEEEALAAVAIPPVHVALLDLGLPEPEHGFQTLARLLTQAPLVPVIVITGEKDMASHVRAMRDGAFDYVTKPIDLGKLEQVVARALAVHAESGEALGVTTDGSPAPLEGAPPSSELVGEAPPMRLIFKS